MTPNPAAILVFGRFRLHADPLRLCCGDEELRLGGRALDLLSALVSRPGEVLSRSELEAKVWPHSVVEDSSLRVHIAALRRALGDGIDGAHYIANVPGRGYRFVAAVASVAPESGPSVPSAPTLQVLDNLPTRLTRLIGREAVVDSLAAELARCRLVSIVGHGGIGKTSLALALAARVRHAYVDGVCFVDLAPLTAPGHVIETVAAALGLPLPSETHIAELENWLRPRRLLLVLDNCEHVLDAVAGLAERVLRRAPALVLLATSREPLDAEGECVHRLQPLATPPAEAPIDTTDALGFPAVELLAERAVASLDTFVLDGGNVHLAADLCRRLDGVPLAIEFAASRVGLLGLQGVHAQLDDRLRLLGSGRRTALPRHRTLRALLDWSYQLLSPQQQEVLRRCGVFKAGFSLEAAAAVLADASLPDAAVRDCLLDLVAKSLVRAELAQTPPSYSLLEITRAYALEQLGSDPQRPAVLRRHAVYMLALVERWRAQWDTAALQHWFYSFAPHIGNLRAALDWCFGGAGDRAVGIELLAAIVQPMTVFLGQTEFRLRARQALDAIDDGVPATPVYAMRIRCMFQHLTLGGCADDPPAFMLAMAAQEDDLPLQLEALYHLHAYSFGGGNYRAALGFSGRVEQRAPGNERADVLHARRQHAMSLHFMGAHDQAADYAASVICATDEPSPLRLAAWLTRRQSMQIVQARILWMQGQGGRASALAAECVRSGQQARFPAALSQGICLAALPIALWQGDHALALQLLDVLEAHLAHAPQPYWASWAAQYGRLLHAPGAPARALASFLGPPDAKQLDHLVTFGAWEYHAQGQARWGEGLVGWSGPELLRIQGEKLLQGKGAAEQAQASAAFSEALALAERQQAPAWGLRAANSLARLRLAQGRTADARAVLAPWLARLDAMGAGRDAQEARALAARA